MALLVRNYIQSLARVDIESGDVESVWIELRSSKGRKTLIGVIYRPPNSSLDVGCKLNEELKLACSKGNDTVVMGDFNIQVDWENQDGTGPQKKVCGVPPRRILTTACTGANEGEGNFRFSVEQ